MLVMIGKDFICEIYHAFIGMPKLRKNIWQFILKIYLYLGL